MEHNIESYRNIFCIGIGGSGMSGIARILSSMGISITGSDANDSSTLKKLRDNGIKCIIGHSAFNLPPDTDLVIYSPAIAKSNPERKEAARKWIKELSYPQALGLLTGKFKTVSVCGTHGKTTTTGLTASSFIINGKDPTVLVGSSLKELNGYNSRVGEGEWFILESCEYKRAFLNYSPYAVILTNIEADHLDYYKNIDDYESAFSEFIGKIKKGGILIACGDQDSVVKICINLNHLDVRTYGVKESNDYVLNGDKIYHHGELIASLDLKIPGVHNRLNATATIALSHTLGLDIGKSIMAVNGYMGAHRRFEIKGKMGKTLLIDDYAHHPTEIKATLKSLRERYGDKSKILCVFQPHQYSRTYKLLNDFAKAFGDADDVIIPNIFKVRDKVADISRINEEILVKEISVHHPSVIYGGGMDKTYKLIKKIHSRFDIIITLGAGDIDKLADRLKNS